jgi:hypothetical protein
MYLPDTQRKIRNAVPALTRGLLDLIDGRINADQLVEFALSSPHPNLTLAFLQDSTFRSSLFMRRVILPNENKVSVSKFNNMFTSPLKWKDRTLDVSDLDARTSSGLLDPVVRYLGYRAFPYTNGNRADQYYINKLLQTPKNQVEEIKTALSPWAQAWEQIDQSISDHGYYTEFNYQQGSEFIRAVVIPKVGGAELPKYESEESLQEERAGAITGQWTVNTNWR